MRKKVLVTTPNTTMKGDATVNIDEIEELKNLIKRVAIISVDKSIKVNQIYSRLSQERRLYRESLNVIPEESEDEKIFRKRAEDFFYKIPVGFWEEIIQWTFLLEEERWKFEQKQQIEIACASYKLYKECKDITQKAIYEKAKERMSTKPKSTGYRGSWGSKFSNIQDYTGKYFPELVKALLRNNKQLNHNCSEFLEQYEYKGIEKTILKLIFLIESRG